MSDPVRVYCHDGHELWLADCLDPEHVEAVMQGRVADLTCLDAPYSDRTHAAHRDGKLTADRAAAFASANKDHPTPESLYSARKSAAGESGRRDIDYAAWSAADVHRFVECWEPHCKGWRVSITDSVLQADWTRAWDAAGLYVFSPLPLVETGGRVRMLGDGPSSWTCWVVVARPRHEPFSKWGTLNGAYVQPAERDINSSGGSDRVVGGKPVKAMCRIVEDYSRRGDLVVDPTCGAGTANMAAKMTGRRSIGIDTSGERLEIAARRLRDSREQTNLFDKAI